MSVRWCATVTYAWCVIAVRTMCNYFCMKAPAGPQPEVQIGWSRGCVGPHGKWQPADRAGTRLLISWSAGIVPLVLEHQ